MINIRYAGPEDYERTSEQFSAMGTPEAKPAAVREYSPDEIVLYRENLPGVEDRASALRHEIGHVRMGHTSVPFDVVEGKGVDKAAQAKYSLQEFEAIYWGYYTTGVLDRDSLQLERQVATSVLGPGFTRILESRAKGSVKRKLGLVKS